jgi:hypothetical protein
VVLGLLLGSKPFGYGIPEISFANQLLFCHSDEARKIGTDFTQLHSDRQYNFRQNFAGSG